MAKKVVLDAGHGGNDLGLNQNGIIEKDFNLQINNYLSQRLNEMGVANTVTRNSDETIDNSERLKRIKNAYGDKNDVILLVSSLNTGGNSGTELIYALRNDNTLTQKLSNAFENAGFNVNKFYQRRLPSDSSKDYYYQMRDTSNIIPVIVEYGYIDSETDASKLKNNWQEYAEALLKGLTEYIGVNYIPATTGENIYVVKKGDTLYSIAKRYGITVDELKRANNLTSNTLSINQKLVIPAATEENIYVVKKGDTLYSIAKRYGITVDELKRANNLTSNTLSINQKLVIPAATEENIYVVKKGDTLYSIAKRYGITVDELKRANNLTSNTLSINQKLIIPN